MNEENIELHDKEMVVVKSQKMIWNYIKDIIIIILFIALVVALFLPEVYDININEKFYPPVGVFNDVYTGRDKKENHLLSFGSEQYFLYPRVEFTTVINPRISTIDYTATIKMGGSGMSSLIKKRGFYMIEHSEVDDMIKNKEKLNSSSKSVYMLFPDEETHIVRVEKNGFPATDFELKVNRTITIGREEDLKNGLINPIQYLYFNTSNFWRTTFFGWVPVFNNSEDNIIRKENVNGVTSLLKRELDQPKTVVLSEMILKIDMSDIFNQKEELHLSYYD